MQNQCKLDMGLFSPFCSNWKTASTTLPFCGTERPSYWKPFAKCTSLRDPFIFPILRRNCS